MSYEYIYRTPCGFSDILIESSGEYLTGLTFISDDDGIPYTACEESMPRVIRDTINWLDIYFSGDIPSQCPEYRVDNVSEFTCRVLEITKAVPYGQTVTYKEIAARIAEENGMKQMSSQAVGSALGRNPICIIIPCHRIVGSDGKLAGYSGGIENKRMLLAIEDIITHL